MTTELGENLRLRDTYVNSLSRSLANGSALANVPSLIKKVIEEQMWKERFVSQTKNVVTFQSFREFIEADPPEGLNTSIDVLMKICKSYEDMEAVDLLAQESAGTKGGNNPDGLGGKSGKKRHIDEDNNINIINRSSPTGTSTAATMRRLAKDFPEAHARVLSGELSPNAAAKQAGFRKDNFQMPRDPVSAGKYLAQRVDKEWFMACYDAFMKEQD